jgi:hypothetical protein
LAVPAPVIEAARWKLKQRSTDGSFYVWDDAAGETIADGVRREAGLQQIALLEKLAKEQAKAGVTPAPLPEPKKGADPIPQGWYNPEQEVTA